MKRYFKVIPSIKSENQSSQSNSNNNCENENSALPMPQRSSGLEVNGKCNHLEYLTVSNTKHGNLNQCHDHQVVVDANANGNGNANINGNVNADEDDDDFKLVNREIYSVKDQEPHMPHLKKLKTMSTTTTDIASSTTANTMNNTTTTPTSKNQKDPCSFVSWNVNGLSNRLKLKSNWDEFSKYVAKYQPDVIALQEVRLPADAKVGSKRGDSNPRTRDRIKNNDKSSKLDYQMVQQQVFQSPLFSNYTMYLSLSDWKYAGTALLVKKKFSVSNIRYNFDWNSDPSQHHSEGRIIVAEFDSMIVLNTYTPNNGWNETHSFQSRRRWDAEVLEFVMHLDKPLIYLGDLNVAHYDDDVTHPNYFRNQVEMKGNPVAFQDKGQPGFTLAERERFSNLLEKGKLIDAFRFQHSVPSSNDFSWRGCPPAHAKYYGKGMRIDYTLVSESFKNRIKDSHIIGEGAERNHFFGSDHSPIFLALHKEEPST